MGPVRVLFANRPRLMRELLMATISDQPDIEVVGEITDESGIEDAVERSHPDFLIVALERYDRLPAFCEAILQSYPRLKIIAIAADRNTAIFYWASLRVQSSQIEASEAGVLDTLRGVTRPIGRVQ
jgi:DNA-binding NarL/FixJ family response regulator